MMERVRFCLGEGEARAERGRDSRAKRRGICGWIIKTQKKVKPYHKRKQNLVNTWNKILKKLKFRKEGEAIAGGEFSKP